jgi:pectate lyase
MRLLVIFLLCLVSAPAVANQKAFPTADGYGQLTQGGRGGAVYLVTNTNDSGPGSLRECIAASGPRQCIVVTDGDICLASELIIKNPFISIIGQTAPGQGIQLRQCTNLRNGIVVGASEVIIRHIKCRLGPTVVRSGIPDCFAIGVEGVTPHVSNVIIDHGSFAWATDQLMEANPDIDRVTVQDSFFYEGLRASTHTSGTHSKGPNLRHCSVSLVRNLIANNVIRNPNNTCGLSDPNVIRIKSAGIFGENEFRNNVVFNAGDGYFDYWNGRGESEVNVIANVFLRGPSTRTKKTAPYAVDARDFTSKYFDDGLTAATGFVPAGTSDKQSLCLQDNISEGFPGDPGSPATRAAELHSVLDPRDAHIVASTDCINNPVGNPKFGAPRGVTGPVLSVGQLAPPVGKTYGRLVNSAVLDAVLGKSGAIWWDRDTADARIATQVAARQGKIIDHPNQVGGWPVLRQGTRPVDTDSDGMPDEWEILYGLSPGDSADRNGDFDFDGYTNLEEYTFEAAREQVGMGQ